MMKQLLSFATAACLILGSGAATPGFAQARKAVTKTAGDLTVTKATARRVPAAGHAHPEIETSFEIVWNSSVPPQGIYYRQGAHWLKCKPTRPEKRPFGGGPNDFMIMYMSTSWGDFKPGDHLALTADPHSSDVLPEAVKKMPANALYYQLAGSLKWHAKPVSVPKLPAAK